MHGELKLLGEMILNLLSLAIYIFCGSRQWWETTMPKDGLTRLRWIILTALIIAAVSVVPVIAYQAARLFGVETEFMRSLAGSGGGISRFGSAVLLFLIFTYRRRGD